MNASRLAICSTAAFVKRFNTKPSFVFTLLLTTNSQLKLHAECHLPDAARATKPLPHPFIFMQAPHCGFSPK